MVVRTLPLSRTTLLHTHPQATRHTTAELAAETVYRLQEAHMSRDIIAAVGRRFSEWPCMRGVGSPASALSTKSIVAVMAPKIDPNEVKVRC